MPFGCSLCCCCPREEDEDISSDGHSGKVIGFDFDNPIPVEPTIVEDLHAYSSIPMQIYRPNNTTQPSLEERFKNNARVKAMYDYSAKKPDELSFEEGDVLEIYYDSDVPVDRWAHAKHLKEPQMEGLIPINFTTSITTSLTLTDVSENISYLSIEDNENQIDASDTDQANIYASRITEDNSFHAIALFDYKARSEEEMSFKKGDKMEIYFNDENPYNPACWLRAKLLFPPYSTGQIPTNYVSRLSVLEMHEWYFPRINRVEAKVLLKSSQNSEMSFLIRNSDSPNHLFALSVRTLDVVLHFVIKGDEENGFYINAGDVFQTLPELVEYYKNHCIEGAKGQELFLEKPCLREAPATQGLTYDVADQWELERKNLEFGRQLGKGNFGEVYRGLWNHSTDVAIKQLKEQDENISKEFRKETEALKSLHHPNVVQLYGVCTKESPYLIVTELMEKGDLLKYLRKGDGQYLSVEELIDVAKQVASGMAYMESKKFIHRDLAARNILVGKQFVFKVADFGMARQLESEHYLSSGNKFPIKWCSPEVLSEKMFTHKSDVWAFGICLVEIIEKGMEPYPGLSTDEAGTKIVQPIVMQFSIMKNCPRKLYDLMLKCWEKKKESRPTFVEVLKQLKIISDILDPYVVSENVEYGIFNILKNPDLGETFKGTLNGNSDVVIKRLNEVPEDMEDFKQSVDKLKRLAHKHLVRFCDFKVEESKTLIFIEYVHSNLLQYLRQSGEIQPRQLSNMAAQIASGMAYLEENGMTHGNLCAQNIFLGKNNECKISEFERPILSKYFHSLQLRQGPVRAPECLWDGGTFTIKSDVWSYGICLAEMVDKGNQPFSGLSDIDTMNKIVKGNFITMEDLMFCPGSLFKVMEKCWRKEPSDRPSFADLTDNLEDLYSPRLY